MRWHSGVKEDALNIVKKEWDLLHPATPHTNMDQQYIQKITDQTVRLLTPDTRGYAVTIPYYDMKEEERAKPDHAVSPSLICVAEER